MTARRFGRAVQLSQKAYEPEAAQGSEHTREQVQARYGGDVNNAGADERYVVVNVQRLMQGLLCSAQLSRGLER